ncbi:sigma-E processing peptidase SpoIIGA [Sulfoacidibacillus thermotolerans]|uniref:Sigma-E processing peptidase SpoIIGA n=1 Tax=Sulfoacidibacillus thermotolerans TaxID=1765684 RepID=A0A2U3D8U6_SULT2|nr:sigma-E processing peptidase SpoIIGA [Sulfoacidibacillus thermotolerans]PWI57695.1 hypothetical protein BM613_06820 [Sulfoacidibacillus thermotolerans]
MVIYVDLAFFINLFIDGSLLLITGSLLHRQMKLGRVLFAAFVGSVYAVATLFPGTSVLRMVVVKWLVSVWMVDTAFGLATWRRKKYQAIVKLMQVVAAFYAVTFAVAGAIFALHNMFSKGTATFDGLALVRGQVAWWTSISTVFLVLAVPLALLLVRFLWGYAVRMKRMSGQVVAIQVRLFGQIAQFDGLLDTGNTLTDPLTKTPVAIARVNALVDLLPRPLRQAVTEGKDPLAFVYQSTAELGDFAARISVIPYRAVAGNTGYLLAFRPDEVFAVLEGTERSLAPMLIALQVHDFALLDQFACILPGSIAGLLVEGRESGVHTRSRTSSDEASHSSHSA